MYDWKLLEQKTIQQAEQIGEDPADWAEIFNKLGLDCTPRNTNNVIFECPVCQPKGKRRGITFNTIPTTKPYPQWRCHDHPATAKYFGSHIGLVRFLMEHVKGEKLAPWDAYHLVRRIWESLADIPVRQPHFSTKEEHVGIYEDDMPF